MEISEILERYEGHPVDTESMGHYPRWALQYFHDKAHLTDPFIEITLQWDITAAEKIYRKKFCQGAGCDADRLSFLEFDVLPLSA